MEDKCEFCELSDGQIIVFECGPMDIRKVKGKYFIVTTNEYTENENCIEINYCPFCGRKLVGRSM